MEEASLAVAVFECSTSEESWEEEEEEEEEALVLEPFEYCSSGDEAVKAGSLPLKQQLSKFHLKLSDHCTPPILVGKE